MAKTFSVNQLRVWSRCQKQYDYQWVRELAWPSDPKNFRLGKAVHQLLDYEARGLDVTPLLDTTDADIRETWETLRQTPWAQLPVVASEWGFSLDIEQHWLYGRIDRIAQDGDRVVILDWKTGTATPKDPENDWQTVIYLYALYEARRDLGLDITPEKLAFCYVQAKDSRWSESLVTYSQLQHEATGERLRQTLEDMALVEEYRLPARCPDHYCPYATLCGILTVDPKRQASVANMVL